jgi:hypothetical protein
MANGRFLTTRKVMMNNTTSKREYRILQRFDFIDAPPDPINGFKKKAKPLSKWAKVADRMRKINRKHYGKWTKVATDVHFTLAHRMKKSFPDVNWITRKNNKGKHDLWASYSGKSPLTDL